MRKTLFLLVLLGIFVSIYSVANAGYVSGYYRSDGTYVNGYYRTEPDGNPYNNYSFPGNYNPNTGTITGGNPDTYLKNYYDTSAGSIYTPSYNYNYTYPTTPTPPSIPTCPANSYYDGISSCKCIYGYFVSNGSCVSGNTICHNQIGYSSSYNATSNMCECDSGYVIGTSGQCVPANSFCVSNLGSMSRYNSLSKSCECLSGYEFNGLTCVYKQTAAATCPINSSVSVTDPTKCSCNTGFQPNTTNDGCVAIPTQLPSSPQRQTKGVAGAAKEEVPEKSNQTAIVIDIKQDKDTISKDATTSSESQALEVTSDKKPGFLRRFFSAMQNLLSQLFN